MKAAASLLLLVSLTGCSRHILQSDDAAKRAYVATHDCVITLHYGSVTWWDDLYEEPRTQPGFSSVLCQKPDVSIDIDDPIPTLAVRP